MVTACSQLLRIVPALGLALSISAAAEAGDVADLEERLADARCAWDVAAMTAVLAEARSLGSNESANVVQWLQAKAGLSLAEMLRVEFEDSMEGDRMARAALGQRIDAAATGALELLASLPESSERYRVEADLLATMMRSDFRAKKYRKALDAATALALQLDEHNPRAWVTAAKPFLFAGPKQGGDLEEALRHLDRALELEPDLESALLLRAHAYEKMGKGDLAATDRAKALARNPTCGPALRALTGNAE